MKYIDRKDITDDLYREVLDTETHHDHKIIMDEHGVIRWEVNPLIDYLWASGLINLNDVAKHFLFKDEGKNSEMWRKLYRDLGYSLFGYWEIFYWEANNEKAAEYKPTKP